MARRSIEIVRGVAAALAAGAPGCVFAVEAPEAPAWEIGVGAGVVRLPHYRGADRTSTLLLPLPYVVYRGPLLKADRDGARATLAERGPWRLNLSAGISPPVNADDNPARAGMRRLAATVELGPDLIWRVPDSGWSLHLPVRAAFTLERDPRAVGFVSHPHLHWRTRWGDGWNASARGGPLFGTRRYNAYFHGVPVADATPARPAYDARGGYVGLQALAAVSRSVGDRVWLGAYLQADSLRGSVTAASPLVRREHGIAVGVGAAWVFARSSRRVAIDRDD